LLQSIGLCKRSRPIFSLLTGRNAERGLKPFVTNRLLIQPHQIGIIGISKG
jgi:hypothetical protein